MDTRTAMRTALREASARLDRLAWLIDAEDPGPLEVGLDRLMLYLRRTPFAIITAWKSGEITLDENRARDDELARAIRSGTGPDGQPFGCARCLTCIPEQDPDEKDARPAPSEGQGFLIPGMSFDQAHELAALFGNRTFVRDRGDGSVNVYRTETREKEAVADLARFRIIADLRNVTDPSLPGRARSVLQRTDADPMSVLASEDATPTDRLAVVYNLIVVETNLPPRALGWGNMRNPQIGTITKREGEDPLLRYFGYSGRATGRPMNVYLRQGDVIRWAPIFRR